ncbi:Protein of unknown function [Altererythrobacter xiamenensis]|uniref:DUF2924 domain-containing protein n=1 Tax=Altererythrobacter xiamenensis TaxID=1316679 RepID=A0A1Y6EPC2_9SPHN|nr:DUF2924 domain-containing protein [Altererythrobacter xiamenensis]SMQ64407.1 Protein of unknown function [Altererythrobacter xiamenensis]
MTRLEVRLDAIREMPLAELRSEWQAQVKSSAPNISVKLLRLGLAWKIQEKALGGLSRDAKRELSEDPRLAVTTGSSRQLTSGTRLVRDWHGQGHSVTVLEEGFVYDGQHWSSLTAIARHITGAKWSGPRFFGLTGAS